MANENQKPNDNVSNTGSDAPQVEATPFHDELASSWTLDKQESSDSAGLPEGMASSESLISDLQDSTAEATTAGTDSPETADSDSAGSEDETLDFSTALDELWTMTAMQDLVASYGANSNDDDVLSIQELGEFDPRSPKDTYASDYAKANFDELAGTTLEGDDATIALDNIEQVSSDNPDLAADLQFLDQAFNRDSNVSIEQIQEAYDEAKRRGQSPTAPKERSEYWGTSWISAEERQSGIDTLGEQIGVGEELLTGMEESGETSLDVKQLHEDKSELNTFKADANHDGQITRDELQNYVDNSQNMLESEQQAQEVEQELYQQAMERFESILGNSDELIEATDGNQPGISESDVEDHMVEALAASVAASVKENGGELPPGLEEAFKEAIGLRSPEELQTIEEQINAGLEGTGYSVDISQAVAESFHGPTARKTTFSLLQGETTTDSYSYTYDTVR